VSKGAIPTQYAGVQFRSRLEARWAAFFDLIRWKWEYEPIDLDGYIPDFVLEGDYLVEVKPIVKWPCAVIGCAKCNNTPRAEYDAAVQKIERSGWTGRHAILVGAGVFDGRVIGVARTLPCLGRVIASDLYLPRSDFNFDLGDEVVNVWREAGNRVQWRPPAKPVHPNDPHATHACETDQLIRAINETSTDRENAAAYCWRCGYPCGTEAPAEIDLEFSADEDYEVRHADHAQCARNAEETRRVESLP
jgi:hypothetical protein